MKGSWWLFFILLNYYLGHTHGDANLDVSTNGNKSATLVCNANSVVDMEWEVSFLDTSIAVDYQSIQDSSEEQLMVAQGISLSSSVISQQQTIDIRSTMRVGSESSEQDTVIVTFTCSGRSQSGGDFNEIASIRVALPKPLATPPNTDGPVSSNIVMDNGIDENSTSPTVIIAVVVSVIILLIVAGLIVIIFIVVCYRIKRQKQQNPNQTADHSYDYITTTNHDPPLRLSSTSVMDHSSSGRDSAHGEHYEISQNISIFPNVSYNGVVDGRHVSTHNQSHSIDGNVAYYYLT